MMIIKPCPKCGKSYMYDPNMQPEYEKQCQDCEEKMIKERTKK